jgi:hypothetical protein
VIMCLLLSLFGCSWFIFIVEEESVQANSMSDVHSDDDGKNRAAIRGMVAEEHQPSSLKTGADHKRNPEPGMLAWPPNWLASYFSPNRLSKEEKEELERTTGYAPAPSSSHPKRKTGPPGMRGKGPQVTDPPIRGSEAEPR